MVFQCSKWAGIPEGQLARTPTFLAFLQSAASADPSRQPQQSAPLTDFHFPSTQIRFKGPPNRQVSTPVFVPSSGFDYPLDGLLPSNPSEPYLMLTASMGFSPSELNLSARYRDVPTAMSPHAVSLAPDTSI